MKRNPWIRLAPLLLVLTVGSTRTRAESAPRAPERQDAAPKRVRPYDAELFRLTRANDNYRRVLFTGALSQLVVMTIPRGESIGVEEHARVEQTIVVLSGSGQVLLDGRKSDVAEGDVIVVTPGTAHNLTNTGSAPLRLFTIYVPPNHLDGRVHKTKLDAERDLENERFGSQGK